MFPDWLRDQSWVGIPAAMDDPRQGSDAVSDHGKRRQNHGVVEGRRKARISHRTNSPNSNGSVPGVCPGVLSENKNKNNQRKTINPSRAVYQGKKNTWKWERQSIDPFDCPTEWELQMLNPVAPEDQR